MGGNVSASKPRRRVYIPVFEGEIEGWTANHLRENLWRVARTKDRDDCMQEAQIVFLRCARMYPDVNARHFMALYKTAWTNAFHRFSRNDTRLREAEALSDGRECNMEAMGETCNEGELRVMLRQAPREVRMVLNLLLRAPQELADIALSGFTANDGRARNGVSKAASARINAMLGLPPESNTLERVREYFS
jgi:hypothetical protein